MTDIDIAYLQQWVGKQEIKEDDITLFPAQALAAALDNETLPVKGDALPPFWEWLYFLPTPLSNSTGADGHPDKGGFLPPVPLPRRMWAAGEVECFKPLIIGQAATRLSTIESVDLKSGSTGTLVFVNVKHDISQNGSLCISQIQNIVYREQPAANAPLPPAKSAPDEYDFFKMISPDPVLLFRYSALTYNGHRIHYDRRYAVEEELYPALVVHGPLIVTLLLELKRNHLSDKTLRKFKFRAIRPTFDHASFTVAGSYSLNKDESQNKDEEKFLSLWSADESGALCMTIKAELSD